MVNQVGGSGLLTAQAEQIGTPPASILSNKGILYTEVRKPDGSVSRVAVEVKKTDKQTGGILRELMDRVESAVKNVNIYVRTSPTSSSNLLGEGIPHARNVRINFTSLRILYEENDEEKSMAITAIKDVALRTLLLDIAKDIEHHATTDPSISSNRPLNRSTPLEIQTPAWHNAHRISAEDYIKNGHDHLDESLREDLDDTIANHALPKIRAASNFVQKFRELLEGKLQAKRRDMEAAQPSQERGARLALKRQIHQLEELIAKADSQKLDMKAIYTSVPYANNELLGLNPTEQMQRADFSQSAMQADLAANIDSIGKPGAAFITAYSQDKGDLLIHDRWKYEERVDDRGGEKRGPSAEEFFIFNILNLRNDKDEFLDDAMSSLALPTGEAGDSEVQTAVREALKTAREDVLMKYVKDISRLGTTTTDLQAQIQVFYPRPPEPQHRTVSKFQTIAMARP